MLSLMDALMRFGEFACQYGFCKCMKTAVCGMVIMPVLLLWQGFRRKDGRCSDIGFYSWLFLLPAALMSRNKLFFQRWMIWLTAVINGTGATWVSGAYFTVMLILTGGWIGRKLLLNRRVRRLPRWQSPERDVLRSGLSRHAPKKGIPGVEEDMQSCIRQVTAGDRWKLAEWYLGRTRVYITDDSGSPFCGGIFRPYIVMPIQELEPEEEVMDREKKDPTAFSHWQLTGQGRILFCHELLHLKCGHVLWLNLFALLRLYWWANPLVYLCEKMLQQDMEQACDEGCLYYTGVGEKAYGKLLLSVAAGQMQGRLAGTASFLRNRDYDFLKKRICSLRGKGEQTHYRKLHRRIGGICAAALTVIILAVGMTSYPRYTRLPDLLLYGEDLQLLCNDTPELRAAVQVVDGYLQIDEERMDACLAPLEISGSHVYLSYDTIMKVPGAGGCGNTGMIALDDYSDIFYLSADTWENRLMEFCLKYLI